MEGTISDDFAPRSRRSLSEPLPGGAVRVAGGIKSIIEGRVRKIAAGLMIEKEGFYLIGMCISVGGASGAGRRNAIYGNPKGPFFKGWDDVGGTPFFEKSLDESALYVKKKRPLMVLWMVVFLLGFAGSAMSGVLTFDDLDI